MAKAFAFCRRHADKENLLSKSVKVCGRSPPKAIRTPASFIRRGQCHDCRRHSHTAHGPAQVIEKIRTVTDKTHSACRPEPTIMQLRLLGASGYNADRQSS